MCFKLLSTVKMSNFKSGPLQMLSGWSLICMKMSGKKFDYTVTEKSNQKILQRSLEDFSSVEIKPLFLQAKGGFLLETVLRSGNRTALWVTAGFHCVNGVGGVCMFSTCVHVGFLPKSKKMQREHECVGLSGFGPGFTGDRSKAAFTWRLSAETGKSLIAFWCFI